MDMLSDFVERRRRLVVAVWLVVLAASLPFAARQTEHLTNGGFTSPGSGSERVDHSLESFPDVDREGVAAVLALEKDATRRDLDAALKRLRREVDARDDTTIPNAGAPPRIQRTENGARVVLVPIRVEGSRNEAADAVVELREDVLAGESRNVEIQLTGQQALWAGMQDVTKEDLESAEFT